MRKDRFILRRARGKYILPDRNNYYIASSRIQLIPKMRANLSISIELQLLQHLERRAVVFDLKK